MTATWQNGRKELDALWLKGKADGASLISYSRLMDGYLQSLFAAVGGEDLAESVCLVALGGYGRQELFPRSDVDLMILYVPEIKERIGQVADAVLYPLWDSGLEVGHGVRTVAESMVHAAEDYFFHVAMLDARLVCGAEWLFAELQVAFRRNFVEGNRELFVEKMKSNRQSRRERFGSHSYLLEPHLKEGMGGMRDVQAMLWTARVVFGLAGLVDLQSAGLLTEEEFEDFLAARSFLTRIRAFLHCHAQRRSDQLYFEHQADVAKVFGYQSDNEMLAVERFMREVYVALRVVTVITDLFFDHVDEVLGLGGKENEVPDRDIEKGIRVKRGRLHLTAGQALLVAKPQLLLRIFLAMARIGLPMHHRSRKVVATAAPGLISDKVRNSPRVAKAFFASLIEAQDIALVLGTMVDSGVLGCYIPEFGRIEALAQHDLYHIYTVDRHSIQAVTEVHHLLAEREVVARAVTRPRVLYLATLLHDIGKGSGRDHSEVGAAMVVDIGARLGLDESELDLLSFLVRYHLFIPENALRRDLNDAVFIQRCAETIGSVERLAMLYLLAIADSVATGPSAWSDWKAALMEEMYLKVHAYLDHGRHGVKDVAVHEEQGVEWLREQVRVLLRGETGLRTDLNSLGSDYILTFAPQTIASHLLLQRDQYNLLRQKTLVQAREEEEYWSVLIMTTDRPGLLAKICGVMSLNNLNVCKAQIFTWADSTVVDVLHVRPTDGLSFAEKDWGEVNHQLDLAVTHRMGLSHRLYKKLSSSYGRRHKSIGAVAPKVVIDNTSSQGYSVLEVHAPDMAGQLYYITQAMADFGLNIHKAYIATEVEQLIDAFYVLDSRGQKLEDRDLQTEVIQSILHSVTR